MGWALVRRNRGWGERGGREMESEDQRECVREIQRE
jgi:hypothetical protein